MRGALEGRHDGHHAKASRPRPSGAPKNRPGIIRAQARAQLACRRCDGSGIVPSWPPAVCADCEGLGEL